MAGTVAGALAVLQAARRVDRPDDIALTVSWYTAYLRHGWDNPPEVAVARDARGRVVGVLDVSLPQWDNTHAGHVDVTVDPLVRRQGIGRWLFEAGVDRLRAADRSVLFTWCLEGSAGTPFAKAMGLDLAYTSVGRRQDVLAVDWPRLDSLYADAARHADGYELVRMPDEVPADMMADVVRMVGAINDAPTDDMDFEDEVFTPERIAAFMAGQRARHRRIFWLVARSLRTGELAGHTMVAVETDQPGYGWQYDTSVLAAHRGHRLGLLLKIGMLRWLADEEPQLRTIETGNAASNSHMIHVNELLGYEVVHRLIGWQRRL